MITATVTLSPEIHDRFLHNKKLSVVKLVSPYGGSGTGFVIERNDTKFILTNRHVCLMNKGNALSALDQKGGDTIVRVLVWSRNYDLCLMTSRQDLPALKLAKSYNLFEKAYPIGHPLGLPLTLANGRLISKEKIELMIDCKLPHDREIEITNPFARIIYGIDKICTKMFNSVRTDAPIYPGNSGSPVLNFFGNVNGVVFAGSTRAEHASYLVPLEDVKKFLNSIKFK